MSPITTTRIKGFSLSELVIALATIGLIGALVLPSVSNLLGNKGSNEQLLRTSISTLEQALQSDVQLGKQNTLDMVTRNTAVLRTCPSSGSITPCWDISKQGNYGSGTFSIAYPNGASLTNPVGGGITNSNAAVLLKNGVSVAGLDDTNTEVDVFILDANAEALPNQGGIGGDQIVVYTIKNTRPEVNGAEAGRIYPAEGVHKDYYKRLFP
jgi:type II secretory pathway pseudopilin PulG